MADDYNALQIQISAQATNAVRNVNNLARALGRLNTALMSVNSSNLFSLTSATNSFAQAAQGLNGGTRAIRNTANALNNLNTNVGQTAQGSQNLTALATAAQNVSQGVNQATQSTQQLSVATRNVGQNATQGATQTQNLGNALNNVSENARRASRNLRSVSSGASSSKNNFKGLFKELTRVSKMLKLMITRMVLRKVIQGVIDGFKNLAQYSSTFDATLSLLWNSLRQLGNSIAAAVSPLLNAFAPALNYIIQLCIKAVNVINQLISALTGMGTWTRAKVLTDDYAKSLDKSNKSAKELKKTVLGFDELNQLQDNKNNGGGGTSPADMFEQVPIDPKILNFIDEMKKKIGELKKYWDSFLKGFKKGLGDDWKDKFALIKDGALRIKEALKDIFQDPDVVKAREGFYLAFSEMLGAIAGTYVRIGLNIGANLAQGIATALENKTPEIKSFLVEMFSIGTDVSKQIEEFALAIGSISDVLVGDNAIAATTGFTEMFLESFMLIEENAARLGSAIVTLVTQPIIDNKEIISKNLDDMFGVLATFADFVQGMLKDIRDILSDVWEQHLNPMFDSITKGLSSLVQILSEAWNNNISPVLQSLMDMLKPLWEQYIKPIFDDVCHIIGIIGNLVAKLFQSVLVPAFGALVDKWFPRIQDALTIGISIVKAVFQTVATIVQAITAILRSFLQFFETGFTKGWGEACHELFTYWSEEWDNILEKIKGIGISIVEVVQGMINAVIHGLNALGDKVSGMPDVNIPAWLGGGTFSFKGLAFHISDVNLVSMLTGSGGRGFATGGFPEDGLFMANHNELVGKFSNGKTAVANNEQITDGIAQAVYAAMVSANGSGSQQYINNTIQIDGETIARAVTKGQNSLNRRYSPTMA